MCIGVPSLTLGRGPIRGDAQARFSAGRGMDLHQEIVRRSSREALAEIDPGNRRSGS
jgi:hypothetical protein